ncbi:MAG: hypothetical protein ACI4OH_01415 [Mitsuokella sp.]|uniref:hypothetical protein n=1 Tax=Mitsuokella sp. TaxID=2049034 RepID=UPI003D7D7721
MDANKKDITEEMRKIEYSAKLRNMYRDKEIAFRSLIQAGTKTFKTTLLVSGTSTFLTLCIAVIYLLYLEQSNLISQDTSRYIIISLSIFILTLFLSLISYGIHYLSLDAYYVDLISQLPRINAGVNNGDFDNLVYSKRSDAYDEILKQLIICIYVGLFIGFVFLLLSLIQIFNVDISYGYLLLFIASIIVICLIISYKNISHKG